MSTLTVTMEWYDALGNPDEVAYVNLECTNYKGRLEFNGPSYEEQTVDDPGVCYIRGGSPVSDVAVEQLTCGTVVDIREADQQCDFAALGMFVGVPAFSSMGIALAIASVLVVGLWRLRST